MLWHAMPPEVNTARLMAGAGPAPMLQAAAGWEALAGALDAQAAELGTILASLSGLWTGASGERAVAAATPMVAWLQEVALQARQRGLQAAAQAAAYTAALATTPSLPEIAANRVTNAVLVATNFLGINMVPIAANEADYFVRMWNQAAIAMDVYQAQTVANTMFAPLPPMKPIVVPEVGDAVQAQAMGMLAEMSGKTAPELLALAEPPPPVPAPETGFGIGQPAMQFLTQIGQLAGPMQQLTGMLQQSGGLGGGATPDDADARRDQNAPQPGLLGAGALSSHPLAGGSGPSSGAGLLRAGSLPGAGGSGPRTPVLAQMLDTAAGSPVPAATADAGGAGGAKASGTGGGAVPLGAMGAGGAQGAASGAARPGLVAVPLTVDQDGNGRDLPDEGDDW